MLRGWLFVRRATSLACVFALTGCLVACTRWAVAGENDKSANNMEGVATLHSLLVQVREAYPGHVLDVELEKEEYGKGDIWVYEIKLLTEKGRVLKLEYDAISLELLKQKGRPEN